MKLFLIFLSFLSQIKNSDKAAPKVLLECIKHDMISITGSNLRNMLLLTEKDNITDLVVSDVEKMEYHELSENYA